MPAQCPGEVARIRCHPCTPSFAEGTVPASQGYGQWRTHTGPSNPGTQPSACEELSGARRPGRQTQEHPLLRQGTVYRARPSTPLLTEKVQCQPRWGLRPPQIARPVAPLHLRSPTGTLTVTQGCPWLPALQQTGQTDTSEAGTSVTQLA